MHELQCFLGNETSASQKMDMSENNPYMAMNRYIAFFPTTWSERAEFRWQGVLGFILEALDYDCFG